MWCDNPYRRAGACLSPYHGKYRRSRGQTLVLVVLIMLVVALLAALLVAVILANQAHTGRAGDVAALNNTVEAGLRYADYQLTYSADGADWRPTPTTETNPFPYTFGRGQFKLILSYNPQESGELANFIKVECTARLLDAEENPIPFLRRTQIAYKPILLTDYLRFVSNKDRSSLPAILGVPSVSQGTATGTNEVAYATDFYGPIRANTDIRWTRNATTLASSLKVYLVDEGTFGGFARRDRIQTSGSFLLDDGAQVHRWDSSAGDWDPVPSGAGIKVYASTDAETVFDVTLGFATGLAIYVDGVNRPDKNNILRNIRYQAPPSIDATDPTTGQSRYLLLTRDSGTWRNPSGTWYNTGWFGYGQGIYVDNSGDIQFSHDLNKLRNQWMTPTAGANPWDTAGWSYTPPGVEIILHPDGAGVAAFPVVELTRNDGNNFQGLTNGAAATLTGPYPQTLTNAAGNAVGYALSPTRLLLAYPINGTIYCEGNIRVAGVLPPATATGLTHYWDDGSNLNDPSDDQRYYDISIVSGGTIYIEGDLMNPNTYRVNAGLSLLPEDQNTRLALLARDNVCLNMTACGARLDSANTTALWSTNQWQLSSANQVAWNFRSFQPTISPLLYIRHAGLLGTPGVWTTPGTPPVDHPSYLGMTIGGTSFAWDGGAGNLFGYHPTLFATASLTQSPRVTDAAAGADWEVSVRPDAAGLIASGATASIIARPDATSQNNVAIAGFQVLPAKINIDALIFAQEGSWFVLPGPWFNSTWGPGYYGSLLSDPVNDVTGVPSYRMALGSIPLVTPTYDSNRPRIYFTGAITESHTAALGDAHDWLSKWAGPESLIYYTFDGGLRYTPYTDANGNPLLRIPKLPCPPGLILWEKQQ